MPDGKKRKVHEQKVEAVGDQEFMVVCSCGYESSKRPRAELALREADYAHALIERTA